MARPSRPAFPRFFLWLLTAVIRAAGGGHRGVPSVSNRPGDDNFECGWEMGRVGRSIALGHGFSSAYDGNTGATAWEPPLYPYLIGGVFKIFGIYTHSSAWEHPASQARPSLQFVLRQFEGKQEQPHQDERREGCVPNPVNRPIPDVGAQCPRPRRPEGNAFPKSSVSDQKNRDAGAEL